MKYVAVWLGAVATLTIVGLVIWGGSVLVNAVTRDPSLFWVPAFILGILAIATIVAVVEYLTDQRKEAPEVEVIERG